MSGYKSVHARYLCLHEILAKSMSACLTQSVVHTQHEQWLAKQTNGHQLHVALILFLMHL